MLTVHHLSASQSERVIWLCEELGVPYEIVRYERDPVTRSAPPEMKALSPFGTAPVISDGDLVLGETGAIVDYILTKYGEGRLALPADHPAFADYLFWLHFSNGSFMPSGLVDYVLQAAGAADTPIARMMRARSDRALQISEARLAHAAYFAGEAFTAADIMMVLPLRGGSARDPAAWPNVQAYLRRIGDRPAYRQAMKKAEPGLA
jgi:glutathione S-transferase